MKQPQPKDAPKTVDTISSVVTRFPWWPWSSQISDYGWKPKIPKTLPILAKWPHEQDDWRYFRDFFTKLCWKADSDASVSTAELACLFWWRGNKHSQLEASVSLFQHLILVFRAMLKCLTPSENCQPYPGSLDSKRNKCCARELQKGVFLGVDVSTDDERLQLVRLFDDGAGRNISTWDSVLLVQQLGAAEWLWWRAFSVLCDGGITPIGTASSILFMDVPYMGRYSYWVIGFLGVIRLFIGLFIKSRLKWPVLVVDLLTTKWPDGSFARE